MTRAAAAIAHDLETVRSWELGIPLNNRYISSAMEEAELLSEYQPATATAETTKR